MRQTLRSAIVLLLSLCGCSVRYTDLSQGRVQPAPFSYNWGEPRGGGMYRCLSAIPGTPVHATGSTQIIGYTRDIVAFWGLQEGNQFSILYYTGGLGWVDGNALSSFRSKHPGKTCIIPGVDRLQRPVFVIR